MSCSKVLLQTLYLSIICTFNHARCSQREREGIRKAEFFERRRARQKFENFGALGFCLVCGKMSHSGNPILELGLDALNDRFRDSLSCEANKPDFQELDLGSPVSSLQIRHSGPASSGLTATTTTTTSTSSSSSKSVSGRNSRNAITKRPDSGPNNHSGELSGSSESSPTTGDSARSGATGRNLKPGHNRSDSGSTPPR